MHVRLATAIVMAAALAAAGLSAMPYAGASQTVTCPSEDFQVAEAKAEASPRTLQANELEVGHIEIPLSEDDRDLVIELDDKGSDGELGWVLYEDQGSNQCLDITQDACDGQDSLKTETTADCRLESDTLSVDEFLVEFQEIGGMNQIDYIAHTESV